MITYLTIFNNGYIEMTKNNVLNFLKIIKNNKLTLVSLDSLGYENLNMFLDSLKENYDTTNVEIKNLNNFDSNFHEFGTAQFNQIMHQKINVIIDELKNNDILHYFDGDVFFFKDPSDLIIEKLKSFDIVFQQDSPRTPRHNGWDFPVYSNYVCAGNFSIKKNDKTFKFLNEIKIRLNIRQHDQETLFHYLNSVCTNIKEYKDCLLDVYDPELFQNGYDTFFADWYKKENKISVHANYMVGLDKKINSLKSIGGWLI